MKNLEQMKKRTINRVINNSRSEVKAPKCYLGIYEPQKPLKSNKKDKI